MIKKFIEIYFKYKEKILYLFFGGWTTVINYIVFFAFYMGVGLAAWVSTTIAWVAAVLFAYVTNKIWVFESKGKDKATLSYELKTFFGARIISYGIQAGLSFVFIDWLGFDAFWQSFVVLTISNIIVVIFNYFASKYIIFKSK